MRTFSATVVKIHMNIIKLYTRKLMHFIYVTMDVDSLTTGV